jgi:hypothetical protein
MYGHLLGQGVGLHPGFGGFGANYRGYGHLQGYGVGLHPGYDPYGAQYGYAHSVAYPMYYQVQQYVQKPFRGGKG